MSDVTQLLELVEAGDPAASDQLLPVVYNELRKLAAAHLASERPGQTLQATALVHEAYLRLIGPRDKSPSWNSRAHFFGAAAEAMRRILVDAARRKASIKHGGGFQRCDLLLAEPAIHGPDDNVLAVDEALSALAIAHPVKAELVKLRYFAGLTLQEAAAALDLSPATADRHWRYARAWLTQQLRDCASRD